MLRRLTLLISLVSGSQAQAQAAAAQSALIPQRTATIPDRAFEKTWSGVAASAAMAELKRRQSIREFVESLAESGQLSLLHLTRDAVGKVTVSPPMAFRFPDTSRIVNAKGTEALSDLFKPASEIRYGVFVDGRLRSSITLELQGDAWEVTSFGDTSAVAGVISARSASAVTPGLVPLDTILTGFGCAILPQSKTSSGSVVAVGRCTSENLSAALVRSQDLLKPMQAAVKLNRPPA